MNIPNGSTHNEVTCSADSMSFQNYKTSVLGLIPSDWECSNFGDIFTFKQGIQVPVESQNRTQLAGCVRFIRIIDLTDPDEPPRFIKSPGEKYILEKEDLFMVRYGTPGLTGSNFEGVIANNLFYLIPKVKVFKKFFFHALAYRRDDILELSGSSTMPAISFGALAEFKIITPSSVSEQTAIANALSDVDALIQELEKLIAKKQAIKIATMQQLLTGRTRLPQFAYHADGSKKGTKQSELGEIPEDWEAVTLGEVAEVRMCKRILSYQTSKNGEIPFFKIGTFGDEPDAFISETLYREFLTKYSYPKQGDVLISAAGTLGKMVVFDGKPSYFQDSNIVWLEIDKQRLSNEYLYQYYKVIKWASSEGSTISRLYNGIIKASVVTLPPLAEQTSIATILSDMDEEVQALVQRLSKTRQIKQGMMQELLTGRTRLVKPESE